MQSNSYIQGLQAFHAGLSIEAMPVFTDDALGWQNGWLDAQTESMIKQGRQEEFDMQSETLPW